jgi:hypothetical protein
VGVGELPAGTITLALVSLRAGRPREAHDMLCSMID